jgi:hypothetical protein
MSIISLFMTMFDLKGYFSLKAINFDFSTDILKL